MTFAAVYLNEEDDVVSVRDRLDWARDGRVGLVFPETEAGDPAPPHWESLDLILIRRHADELRLQVGVVSADRALRRRARGAGLPAFRTLHAAERRRRWRARRPAVLPSRAVSAEDRAEAHRRLSPAPLWRRWLGRYVGVAVFFLVLAAIIVLLAYAVPSATLVLQPVIEPIGASRQVVADPMLEDVDASSAAMPGRRLRVNEVWQASVETTGTSDVPDAPARGQVVFANQLPEPVTVPAGTRVSTSGGQRVVFQVIESVPVAGAIGATVAADVIAVEPGPAGNVAANAVNRIDGPLQRQLQVRNLEPLAGGGTRQARTVTQSDQDRLRSQVVQQLQSLAVARMESALEDNEFLARDSLRLTRIEHETYSHFVGEQSGRLSLEIRADLEATVVDQSQAAGLMYDALLSSVPPGFSLVPESLRFSAGPVLGVDDRGRVSFEMLGRAQVAADLNLAPALTAILGQDVAAAQAYLGQQLPLRSAPELLVYPPGYPRLPYVASRIRVDVRLDR